MILFALLGGASQAQEVPKPPGDSGKQQDEAKPPAPAAQEQYKGDPTKPNCEKPHSWEEADYCAQVRMAVAAEQTLVWIRKTYDLNKWQFGAVVIATLFAGAAAFYARGAAVAANRTVEAMGETAERQLRAYVAVSDVKADELLADSNVQITFKFKNFGQTPADKILIWATAKLVKFDPDVHPIPEFSTPDGDPRSMLMLPPTLEMRFITAKKRYNQDEARGMQSGDLATYVWGKISYRDVFGRDQFTTFHVMWGGNAGNAIVACRHGNEAT